MKKSITYIALVLLALVAGSCTRNNGDIGSLFGNWRVESLKADGAELPIYDDGTGVLLYYWSFQSHIICINSVFPHDEVTYARGSWEETDGTLTLDFNYTDVDGSLNHTPPAALHLAADGVTRLETVSSTSREMTLRYTDTDGVTYTYHLKKAY